jgi:O-antigen/teichoic acid export membrane protein
MIVGLIDQGFASTSNFVVGVIIARIDGPAGLGAYSVAYALWLLLTATHRSIVTDPMSIDTDAHRDDAPIRLRSGRAAEFWLGVVVAVPIAAAGAILLQLGRHETGSVLLVLAPFLPFLLVQDYWRWTGFMQGRPGKALANDAVFNVVQAGFLVALIVAGYTNIIVAIVAWGVGAIAGAIFGLRQFRVRVHHRGGFAHVASRWSISRWLLATGVAGWAGSQAYPFFAGPFVGADGLGGLKAAQSLVSGPSLVLLQASGSVGLPEASKSLEDDGPARLARVARGVTIATTASVGLVSAVVILAAPQLLGWVYGQDFVQYANTARIIAFAWVINCLTMGPVLILKTTRETRALFNISVINMIVLIALIVLLSIPLGVNGTAWAMLVTWTLSVVLNIRASGKALRNYSAPDIANDVQHDA